MQRIQCFILVFVLAGGSLEAQTLSYPPPRVRLTNAGESVTGLLVKVDGDALMVLADQRESAVRIPLSAISKAEVSSGNRSPAATVFSVVIGLGAGLLAGTVAAHSAENSCRSDPSCHTASPGLGPGIISGAVVGLSSGVVIGLVLGRERWRRVPVASLIVPSP